MGGWSRVAFVVWRVVVRDTTWIYVYILYHGVVNQPAEKGRVKKNAKILFVQYALWSSTTVVVLYRTLLLLLYTENTPMLFTCRAIDMSRRCSLLDIVGMRGGNRSDHKFRILPGGVLSSFSPF